MKHLIMVSLIVGLLVLAMSVAFDLGQMLDWVEAMRDMSVDGWSLAGSLGIIG